MTIKEILCHLNVGSTRSVVVDYSLIDRYPGYVRTVEILDKNRVRIEFNTYEYDEGGWYFVAQYDSLNSIIEDLEEYFGKTLTEWENYTKTGHYPEEPDLSTLRDTHNKFKIDLQNKSVPFPKRGMYKFKGNI